MEEDKIPQNMPQSEAVKDDFIKTMLEEANLAYDPQVADTLTECMEIYLMELMSNAKVFMKHADRTQLSVADVRAALKRKKPCSKRMSHTELLLLAYERNKVTLPLVQQQNGLRITPESYNLAKSNYGLKNPVSQAPIPLMNITNRSQMISTFKSQIGMPMMRTSMVSPMNFTYTMTPQRIYLKPNVPPVNKNSCILINKGEDSAKKRIKFNNENLL